MPSQMAGFSLPSAALFSALTGLGEVRLAAHRGCPGPGIWWGFMPTPEPSPANLLARVRQLGLVGWGTIATIVASVAGVLALFIGGGSENSSPPQGESESPVAELAKEAAAQFHTANYEGYWELFHPAVKEAIPLDEWVSCETAASAPATLRKVSVGYVTGAKFELPGAPESGSIVALDVVVEGPEGEVKTSESFDVVEDDNQPYLLPAESEYSALIHGRCPSENLLPGTNATDGFSGDQPLP